MLDRSAFEDPVGLREAQGGTTGEAFADVLIALEIIFAAPAVEAESLCAPVLAAADNDRSRVAEPDVAERFDDHLRERPERARAFRRPLVRRDQPNLLALAAGVHRLRECRDLALRRLQIAEPQFGIAREPDPHRFMRRPFREWRRHDGARRGPFCN